MRSDRGGSVFCVLAIQFIEKALSPDNERELGGLIRSRVRLTDDAGWLDDGRLGLLLPETDSTGARKVARDLADRLEGRFGFTRIECFEHPERRPLTEVGEPEMTGTWEGRGDSGVSRNVLPISALLSAPIPSWKRAMDLACASAGLAVISPFLVVVAAAIKATSPGPVFFVQWREGYAGRRFRMFKFRTMRVGADRIQHRYRAMSEQDGPAFKLRDDPRVTWIGHLLRKSCVDELPQLINVIRGDMSLVGPRPLPVAESLVCEGWQRRRLDVVPGLTCDWQANGGPRVTFDEWMRMDLRYARRIALGRDLALLAKTFLAVATFRASH